ncbi:hypothetical protein EB796_004995 [Bugula neritina]|uniref:Uncharacterized protein n=1 Tax=Bugula neritina TaxID=10212 RepID=A0A7J7KDG2_BUGNE|nr:hypothetical protein EB796_004995 [Bugula neritina]
MMVTQSQVICFNHSTGLHYFLSTRMKANRNKHHTYTLCPYTFTLTQAAKIRCCLRDGLQHVASEALLTIVNIP